MSDVTDADRRTARDVLRAWVTDNPDVPATPPRAQVALVETFAQALADERAKARGPFLAIADDYWGAGVVMGSGVAADIRRAAEDRQ